MNVAGTKNGESLLSGRCHIKQQGGPGRHRTTAKKGRRKKWSQDVNGIVIECYYSSEPRVTGYTDRIYTVWKESRMFYVKEQRMLDQKWKIVKKLFTDLELNEIK